jgi:hypothetical protein
MDEQRERAASPRPLSAVSERLRQASERLRRAKQHAGIRRAEQHRPRGCDPRPARFTTLRKTKQSIASQFTAARGGKAHNSVRWRGVQSSRASKASSAAQNRREGSGEGYRRRRASRPAATAPRITDDGRHG